MNFVPQSTLVANGSSTWNAFSQKVFRKMHTRVRAIWVFSSDRGSMTSPKSCSANLSLHFQRVWSLKRCSALYNPFKLTLLGDPLDEELKGRWHRKYWVRNSVHKKSNGNSVRKKNPVGHFGLKMCHGSIPHVLLCPIYFCLTLNYNCNDNKKRLLCCAIVPSKELAHISRSPCAIFIIYPARKLLEGIKFAKWHST